jgi:hypothetical protein
MQSHWSSMSHSLYLPELSQIMTIMVLLYLQCHVLL